MDTAMDLRGRVEAWLRALGCTPVLQHDENADWHLKIDYPARGPHVMHVLSPKSQSDLVVLVTATDVGKDHHEAFNALDDEAKEDILWSLRRSLNQVEVDFTLDGVRGPLDLPARFQVSRARYEDGLTRDSFLSSLGAIFKVELSASWVLQEKLGGNGHSGGGRFDFKKLGF